MSAWHERTKGQKERKGERGKCGGLENCGASADGAVAVVGVVAVDVEPAVVPAEPRRAAAAGARARAERDRDRVEVEPAGLPPDELAELQPFVERDARDAELRELIGREALVLDVGLDAGAEAHHVETVRGGAADVLRDDLLEVVAEVRVGREQVAVLGPGAVQTHLRVAEHRPGVIEVVGRLPERGQEVRADAVDVQVVLLPVRDPQPRLETDDEAGLPRGRVEQRRVGLGLRDDGLQVAQQSLRIALAVQQEIVDRGHQPGGPKHRRILFATIHGYFSLFKHRNAHYAWARRSTPPQRQNHGTDV